MLAERVMVAENAGWARLYYNVTLIDCESSAVLEEILATLDLGPFVISRLSDRTIIVDDRRKAQITRALARRGSAYRVIDLPPAAPLRADEGNL